MIDSDASNWDVLIVDDDDDNLRVACEFLAFRGAKVRSAQDGKEGLKLLEESLPTFILLDLSMPTMDGWAMIKEIRRDAKFANLPVIALTANALPDDQERAVAAGFDGYITKPFMLTTFVDDIQHCLKQINKLP